MSGDDGNDDLFGGPADDVVNGGDGNDNLTGNFGNDTPLGGKGDDTLFGDAFFDDPGAFDVCNGQQGFDLSATCEVNNQRQPEQGHTARARLVGLATWVSARCSQPCAASRTAFTARYLLIGPSSRMPTTASVSSAGGFWRMRGVRR